jgi:hypothetical protein
MNLSNEESVNKEKNKSIKIKRNNIRGCEPSKVESKNKAG